MYKARFRSRWVPTLAWERYAIHAAAERLNAASSGANTKKYIVLVTDGAPNTCLVRDPQCGQDASVAAVQAAFGAGIRTLVVGLGGILTAEDDTVP